MGKIDEIKTPSNSPMMGRIERMVAEMCPEGVKWVKLCEVVNHIRTGLNPRVHFKLNTPDADGFYITVRELSGFDITPCDKTDRINSQAVTRIQERSQIKVGDVLFSGTGTIGRTALVTKEPTNWNVKEGVYILTPIKKLLNSRFLIHLLHSKSIVGDLDNLANGSTVRSIAMKDLKDLPIPLPPLPIQEAIADILDKFDRLSAELQTELQAELQARKQQYEYYRNQLLTRFAPDQPVTEYSLGELCELYTGGELSDNSILSQTQSNETPFAVYANGKEVYGYTNTFRIDKDAVCISSIGANTGAIFYHKAFFTPIIRLKVLIPKDERLLTKYLFYALSNTRISGKKKQGGIPNINANDVKSIIIPVPPLSEQSRIVSILDKFEALVNDLSQGLPAEIAAVKEQYEYYRNKLLTFQTKE